MRLLLGGGKLLPLHLLRREAVCARRYLSSASPEVTDLSREAGIAGSERSNTRVSTSCSYGGGEEGYGDREEDVGEESDGEESDGEEGDGEEESDGEEGDGEEESDGEEGDDGEESMKIRRKQSVCLPTVFLPPELQKAVDSVITGI